MLKCHFDDLHHVLILHKIASLVHGPKLHNHTWTNFFGELLSSRTPLVMDLVTPLLIISTN